MDLAKKIGVNEMTIVNWERGKTKPDRRKFEKLRKIFRGPMPSNWTGKIWGGWSQSAIALQQSKEGRR